MRAPNPVPPEELLEALRAGLPQQPYSDPDDGYGYFRAVLHFAHHWFRALDTKGAAAGSYPARLLFPAHINRVAEAVEVYGFADTADSPHSGHTYVCNETLTRVGRLTAAPTSSMAANEYIVINGFGDVPAAILSPHSHTVAIYPRGLQDGSWRWEFRDVGLSSPAFLEFAELIRRIEYFWDATIAVPHAVTNLWADEKQWIAVGQAERNIQFLLAAQLDVHFRDHFFVHPEVVTVSGRADISIAPRAGKAAGSATIELKALCSRRKGSQSNNPFYTESRTKHIKAILKGLRQVVDAKKRLEADIGVLACFDMRILDKREDHVTGGIAARAQARGVEVRVYPLYQSSEQRRQHEQGDAQSA